MVVDVSIHARFHVPDMKQAFLCSTQCAAVAFVSSSRRVRSRCFSRYTYLPCRPALPRVLSPSVCPRHHQAMAAAVREHILSTFSLHFSRITGEGEGESARQGWSCGSHVTCCRCTAVTATGSVARGTSCLLFGSVHCTSLKALRQGHQVLAYLPALSKVCH